MDWVYVARFVKKICEKKEREQKEKIYDFLMLMNVIYTDKPSNLAEKLLALANTGMEKKAQHIPEQIASVKRLQAMANGRRRAHHVDG